VKKLKVWGREKRGGREKKVMGKRTPEGSREVGMPTEERHQRTGDTSFERGKYRKKVENLQVETVLSEQLITRLDRREEKGGEGGQKRGH